MSFSAESLDMVLPFTTSGEIKMDETSSAHSPPLSYVLLDRHYPQSQFVSQSGEMNWKHFQLNNCSKPVWSECNLIDDEKKIENANKCQVCGLKKDNYAMVCELTLM